MLEAIEKELIKKEQKPSLIFITGDLVHGGQADEYQVAKEFCDQLLKITGLPKDRLFIVPGNHDVNRNDIKPIHTKNWYQFETQDDISEILSDDDISSILLRKLKNFYTFYNDFFGSEINVKDHSIITQSIEIAELSIKINLLGLNSALFSGYDGDDKNKLAFGSYQIEQALQTMDKCSMLSIAFFHHPFSCFHPSEEPIQNQIKQHADIILTGHLHDPSNMSQHDSSGKVITIGAGASYETRESENSFNLGVVNTETGKGKIQFYKYISRANRWTKNTDVNLDEEDGHFPFELPSVKEKLITSTRSKSDKETSAEQVGPVLSDTLLSYSSIVEKDKNIRIVGDDEYMVLLAELIEKSKKEVLFTSTKMASTNEQGGVGALQKIIIEKSKDFKEKHPDRLHYGIIDSSNVETSVGAAELRYHIDDIVLRFNKKLNAININVFISDEKLIVLRMKGGVDNKDRFSLLIENKDLARILKQYFYSLWEKSRFMDEQLGKLLTDHEENTLENIYDILQYPKQDSASVLGAKFNDFLVKLKGIDNNHQLVPSRFIEKTINTKPCSTTTKLVQNKYKDYCRNWIKNGSINSVKINEIKKTIDLNKSINYKELSEPFFVQYFLSNYFKSKHSLDSLTQDINIKSSSVHDKK